MEREYPGLHGLTSIQFWIALDTKEPTNFDSRHWFRTSWQQLLLQHRGKIRSPRQPRYRRLPLPNTTRHKCRRLTRLEKRLFVYLS